MRYKYEFYKDNKPLNDFSFNDLDVAESVAFTVAHVIDTINYNQGENDPTATILNDAMASLLSDSTKSKSLQAKFLQFFNLDSFSRMTSINGLLDELKKFGACVGLVVVIKAIEPQTVPSLVSLAANTLIQCKHKYGDQIKKIPNGLFAIYPNLYTNPNDYIKTRLDNFLDAYTLSKLETKVFLELSILLKRNSVNLQREIHGLFSKVNYKTTFTADMRTNLSAPIIKLMNQRHAKVITDEEFTDCARKIILDYKPRDAELKFLLRLKEILLDSETPARDLHDLLKDNNYSLPEALRPTLRDPLIEIIKDFNKFVHDTKKTREASVSTFPLK